METLDLDHDPVAHREARAALTRLLGDRLADLRRLDRAARLREIAAFVALALAGGALAAWSLALDGAAAVAARVLGTVGVALAVNAFVLLLHEGMHGVLFRSPRANRWASVALGAPALIAFTAYRVMHTRHHDFLGTEHDPDDYHNYTGRRGLVWALHYVRLTVGCVLYLLAIPFLAWRHGTAADRRALVEEYALLGALYGLAVALVPLGTLATVWLWPLLLVAVMVQVRGFTQHGITDAHDALLASRSIEAHPAVAFLLLNENYHLEHHLFPEVPSYHLPALHRAIWDRLPRAVGGRSYLGFLARFVRQTATLDETPIGLVAPAAMARAAAAPPRA